MEDYHVAEYRKKKDHVLGLFAIFDGHLGDRVPTYLKDNLFDNILQEVCLLFICMSLLISSLFVDRSLLELELLGLLYYSIGGDDANRYLYEICRIIMSYAYCVKL